MKTLIQNTTRSSNSENNIFIQNKGMLRTLDAIFFNSILGFLFIKKIKKIRSSYFMITVTFFG